MGKVIMSGIVPPLVAPMTEIMLGTIAEGSTVKLNENGSPVEFYVAKHDYESALNGTGRTLLVRKDCYGTSAWDKSNVNAWARCTLLSWLNGNYLNLLDEDTRGVISTTKYYYTPGNGNTSVTTRSDAVFQLSVTELGISGIYINEEGTALDIASILQIAYLNGRKVIQWTRSPHTLNTNHAWCLTADGSISTDTCSYSRGSRPAFTLPSGAMFDKKTMLFNGKIA